MSMLTPSRSSFKCDQCGYEGGSDKRLKQHDRIRHKISKVDGSNNESDDGTFLSEQMSEIDQDCFKSFDSDKTDPIDEDFFKSCSIIVECPSCDKIFKTADKFSIQTFMTTSHLNRLGIQKVIMKSCCCYQNPSSDG